ncbi:hypothetical protein RJ639_040581 [Escallonia herrerae]|uniref:Uncharacterized protein n=1 Tax=Escallonia herrerae TaxID=1293975 RepID=A0AA88WH85_9ASTE|nr:hypothetical protein RJ639_040581 [Escallonia herrerae]
MKLALWCLQPDFVKRPSMSVVVKVLEGVMDVEPGLNYGFLNVPAEKAVAKTSTVSSVLASVLSGPRSTHALDNILGNLSQPAPLVARS